MAEEETAERFFCGVEGWEKVLRVLEDDDALGGLRERCEVGGDDEFGGMG